MMGRFPAAYPEIKLEIVTNDEMVDIVAEGFDAGIRAGQHLAKDTIMVPVGPPMRFAVVGATPNAKDRSQSSEPGRRSYMVRVLVIGYAPEAVDFGDPAVPPGLDAAGVADGLQRDLRLMQDRGWDAEHLSIRPDGDLRKEVLDHLSTRSYDCIVIGAGVRMTTKHVPEFEAVVNAVRQGAPETPLAFNSSPDSSGEAVARCLNKTQASD